MNASDPSANEKQNSQSPWRAVFAMDYRSLAIYRISLGIILLADILFRLPTTRAMLTDDGYMTRKVVYRYYETFVGNNWEYAIWSLHWMTGGIAWQYALFAIAAIFAIMLTLGWHTRIATIGSWVLVASLHVRNPLILTSGDTILKLLLLWSAFLPLSRRWSLDARKRPYDREKEGEAYSSFASAGFIMQIVIMYFFTGIAKCNDIWFGGTAMEYVMRLDIYMLPLGKELLAYPTLLVATTYATLFIEVILIWWLFTPRRNGLARMCVMLSYWAFHIGIGLTMSIGLFPLICLMIWLPLVPSSVWNYFGKRTTDSDEKAPSLKIFTPKGRVAIVGNAFFGIVMVFVILLNISNIDHPTCQKFMPRSVVPLGFWLNLDQRFQMFGVPPKGNPWFVYEAQLKNGEMVDLMRHPEKLDHARPEVVRTSLPGHHWRKLHRNLINPIRGSFRQPLVDYMVRKWNAEHSEEEQVIRVRLIRYVEFIGPQYNATDRHSEVWATYNDKKKSAGSVFDQMSDQLLDDKDGLPF